MILKMFSVYDKKAEAYLQPFFAQTRGAALRSFGEAVLSDGHAFKKYPEDYALFEVGIFNDNTGDVIPYASPCSPALVIEAKDIVAKGE